MFVLPCNPGRFSMLKTFMMNNSVDSIEVEEYYQKMTRDDRTDRYVTQTLFQLEAKYGTSKEAQLFIQDVIKGPPFVSYMVLFSCNYTNNFVPVVVVVDMLL